ncbi:hypothetical protein EX895_003110 [Sporisorium graminicola]|uniref:VPS9 domain-containing protein n=1 Tax=Sporisorium graminicola TaxID=280036 RepID=A0A4U7KTV5_9BASI|nr:hypothetical protein EX895_003110 [Sporisorium graminicola]TKY88014.1 hypothetical protein EX895_003110 [Sporisorium graminicola]
MASSTDHAAELSSGEAADNKSQSIVPESRTDQDLEALAEDTSAEDTSAHIKAEKTKEEEEPASSTAAEALADDVEKISLEAHEAHARQADVSGSNTTIKEATETEAIATEQPASNDTAHHNAGETVSESALKSGDVRTPEHAVGVGAADQTEPTTGSSTSEDPTSTLLKELRDGEACHIPHPLENPLDSASSDEAAKDVPESDEQAPSSVANAPAEDSTAPPSVPSKEAPQPPEKTTASATTHNLASPDTPSTPPIAAQKAAKSNREALADPESVAAVAHAFGRESPALRSSTDTPQRIATPIDNIRAAEAKSDQAKDISEDTPWNHAFGDAESSRATTEIVASESEKGVQGDKIEDTPRGGIRIGKGPPPATQASEELPFDFNRFLEQMKHRSAQPVSEYVRSFIKGFSKKPYRTQDQIKLIFDFLDFIAARMRECDVWRELSDSDFENAKEAMEKLVMNRLYPYTFTPAVQKEGRWAVQTDDLERDRVLRQRIGLFGWLSEEHLDVPVGDHSRGFIEFSIQELLKINHYKAPRDKLICILNCCKVIFGMIRHLSTQENADTFIPVLIFVVLKANPEHLISNVEYISRFRNPDRLSSESGYYLSSLMGAIAFIETMDYTSLSNITQEEFEKRVEEAVSSLAEPEVSTVAAAAGAASSEGSLLVPPTTPPPRGAQPPFGNAQHQRSVSATSVSAPSGPGEEAAKALPFTPMAASLADDTRAFFLRTGEAARTGLSRPMGALGRLINEGIEGIRTPSNNDSGASTERQNSPAPPAAVTSTGMTSSTSRSKLFGGLFGSLDTSDGGAQARAGGYPGQQGGRRSTTLVDDEPHTPSTDDLIQDGFHPYQAGGAAGGAPNAPPRLLRPNMPQRNYSIDDTMFDDESAGRRNLMAMTAGSGRGQRDADFYDDDPDSDDGEAAAAEQMHRRMRMQQDFGTPSRPTAPAEVGGQGRLQAGRREDIAFENAQTEQAIQRSLMDQQRLDAVQADEAAQNSASVETLRSIFPTVDEGVIQMVLQGCEGNVETAIDRLLEMQ